MARINGLTVGAAIGTLLGSLAVALYPKRQEIYDAVMSQTNGLSDKAREYADQFLYSNRLAAERAENRAYQVASGTLGVLIGAALALAFAPRTGKQIRGQLNRAYRELFGKTQEVIHSFRNNSSHVHRAIKRAASKKKLTKRPIRHAR